MNESWKRERERMREWYMGNGYVLFYVVWFPLHFQIVHIKSIIRKKNLCLKKTNYHLYIVTKFRVRGVLEGICTNGCGGCLSVCKREKHSLGASTFWEPACIYLRKGSPWLFWHLAGRQTSSALLLSYYVNQHTSVTWRELLDKPNYMKGTLVKSPLRHHNT